MSQTTLIWLTLCAANVKLSLSISENAVWPLQQAYDCQQFASSVIEIAIEVDWIGVFKLIVLRDQHTVFQFGLNRSIWIREKKNHGMDGTGIDLGIISWTNMSKIAAGHKNAKHLDLFDCLPIGAQHLHGPLWIIDDSYVYRWTDANISGATSIIIIGQFSNHSSR